MNQIKPETFGMQGAEKIFRHSKGPVERPESKTKMRPQILITTGMSCSTRRIDSRAQNERLGKFARLGQIVGMAGTIETSVLVIGGGPAGMMTALLLGRAGVPCVLCEQHSGISTHPKAMGITRRTAEIFRQCGLEGELRQRDFAKAETQLMIWGDALCGSEYGRAPLPGPQEELSPCQPFHSPQTHTEKVLLNALSAEPLVRVLFDHRVGRLRDLPHGVEAEIDTPSGGVLVRTEWVVAADGAGSPMRKSQLVEADGPGDLGHFLNVFFHADFGDRMQGRESLLYNVMREDLVEFFVSVNGRDLWLMHHFLVGDRRVIEEEALLALIRSASGVEDLRIKILGVVPWVMSPKVSAKFRVGRIFFTGDAAARLSPAGGMGMNTGLQSAHNLAWKLAEVVNGRARESLLDSYESERHTLSIEVMRHTNDNSSEVFQQVNCALRGDIDGLRALIAGSHRQAEDLRFDVGAVYGNCFRFPHVPLSDGRSTLDWFGEGFVVVAGPETDLGAPKSVRVEVLEQFPSELGCGPSGAVLVRPDGFVAWKKESDARAGDVESALEAVLR